MKKFILFIILLLCVNPCWADYRLLVDHDAVDELNNGDIPEEYITAAKELTVHYAHTSHGSQILEEGAIWLEGEDSTYGIAIRKEATEGLPDQEDPHVVRVYDGCPPDAVSYCEPAEYWYDAAGIALVEAILTTGSYDMTVWTWSSQLTWMSESIVDDYLGVLNDFETDYPDVTVVYITQRLGQSDGSGIYTDNQRTAVQARNNQIRTYCETNNKVLFDYASINSYLDDAVSPCLTNAYHDNYNDIPVECDWPETPDFTCSHSAGPNCARMAKAWWWMMARLAGWDGEASTATVTGVTMTGGSLQ